MTEEEWFACRRATALLKWVRTAATKWSNRQRKLSLFDVACCRRIWPFLTDPRSTQAVEIAERFADGLATEDERQAAFDEAGRATADAYVACRQAGWPKDGLQSSLNATGAAHIAATCGHADEWYRFGGTAQLVLRLFSDPTDEESAQATLLRDLFGNPFRPVALDPSWLTSTVAALAEGIYADRAFDRMPILADALQDAGCDSADILTHCRDPHATHVRGCWVIDLLTNRN